MFVLDNGPGSRRPLIAVVLSVAILGSFFFGRGDEPPLISVWKGPADHPVGRGSPLVGALVARADGMLVVGPPTISAARIDEVLATYGSPAVGTGQTMHDLGLRYGIDPAICLAFFIHESTAGTRGVARFTKSVGNIRTTPGYTDYEGYRAYASWEEGIEDWYKLIRYQYVDEWQLHTVEDILPVYAPPADNNDTPAYVRVVRQLIESWRTE